MSTFKSAQIFPVLPDADPAPQRASEKSLIQSLRLCGLEELAVDLAHLSTAKFSMLVLTMTMLAALVSNQAV